MQPETVFQRHLFIKFRSGQGRQDKELGRRQPGFLGELDHLLDRRPIVLIEYQNEHAVDMGPVTKQKKLPNQQPRHGGISTYYRRQQAGFLLISRETLEGSDINQLFLSCISYILIGQSQDSSNDENNANELPGAYP